MTDTDTLRAALAAVFRMPPTTGWGDLILRATHLQRRIDAAGEAARRWREANPDKVRAYRRAKKEGA